MLDISKITQKDINQMKWSSPLMDFKDPDFQVESVFPLLMIGHKGDRNHGIYGVKKTSFKCLECGKEVIQNRGEGGMGKRKFCSQKCGHDNYSSSKEGRESIHRWKVAQDICRGDRGIFLEKLAYKKFIVGRWKAVGRSWNSIDYKGSDAEAHARARIKYENCLHDRMTYAHKFAEHKRVYNYWRAVGRAKGWIGVVECSE